MIVPERRATAYDSRIRLSAKTAVVLVTMTVVLIWIWINEANTGVSQFGRASRYYRATDPGGFAFSHRQTLLAAALFGVGAVATLCYTAYCVLRRKLKLQ